MSIEQEFRVFQQRVAQMAAKMDSDVKQLGAMYQQLLGELRALKAGTAKAYGDLASRVTVPAAVVPGFYPSVDDAVVGPQRHINTVDSEARTVESPQLTAGPSVHDATGDEVDPFYEGDED